jgi:hypothetical protein
MRYASAICESAALALWLLCWAVALFLSAR